MRGQSNGTTPYPSAAGKMKDHTRETSREKARRSTAVCWPKTLASGLATAPPAGVPEHQPSRTTSLFNGAHRGG